MAISAHTEIESEVIELSREAFGAFCDDISGMFGVDMECKQQEVTSETVKGLKKRFKKLTAVNIVRAEGVLDGTFQLVFDQRGLFITSGVVVMLPENRILEEMKHGSVRDVESMNDAIKEVGNMLVGAWDRVFREELDGHGHFVQTNTFIGAPWDEPEEKISLAGDEEFVFVPYEMTIGSYPSFNCGVIFPKAFFEPASVSDGEQAEPNAEEKVSDEKESVAKEEPEASVEGKNDNVDTNTSDSAVEEKEVTTAESKEQAVPETIRKTARSTAVLPEESAHVSLTMCAEDIMQKDVIWGSDNDSVQQTLTRMQQVDDGYMMVGQEGVLEGIVSKSDLTGAISPYLRPVFAKWRRPLDDATLQIRIKWIMSRPVRTVRLETSLVVIMENMCRFGGGCLPVVDKQGRVQGMVTAFDIFKALLKSGPNISTAGKTPQAPPLA